MERPIKIDQFRKEKNSLSEAQAQDSIFVRISIDCLHPCNSVELSVFHCTQPKDSVRLMTEARTQRGFTEGRILPTPSRTINVGRDEKIVRANTNDESRKADETAKELRAPLAITTFSHASSPRPEDETHEQLTRSAIQVRIARTRAEAPQRCLFYVSPARMVDLLWRE